MPVPRYNIPRHKPSEIKVKSNYIVRMLFKAGYDVGNARDAVKLIEEKGVDKFDFDYPYGSFEEYKKHVLAGEFDVNIKAMIMTDEERVAWDRDVKSGKIRVIHEDHKNCKAWVEYYPKEG